MTESQDDLCEEFSMSKYASSSSRFEALIKEIDKLRKFRSDVASLSLYLCGGHYEPRNNDEAALAGRIIKALESSGASILQRSSWMANRSPIEIEVNESGRLQMRQDQIDAYPDEP